VKARTFAAHASASVARLVCGIAAAAALAACAPLDYSRDVVESPQGAPDTLSYEVASELAPAFESAAERILAASGVRLTADGSTRVFPVPELQSANPDNPLGYDCAVTSIGFFRDPMRVFSLEVKVLWPQPPGCEAVDTIVHELIHAQRSALPDDAERYGHSDDGVFAWNAGNRLLTQDSLTALCEVADCSTFVPEGQP
jgi:hypothetical protein